MDFQVKLYNWQDQGNHVIVLGRGSMDSGAFRLRFDRIEAATQHLSECKVLVDLSDSTYLIDGDEIQAFVARLPLSRWPQNHKIAFVSGPDISDYHRLFFCGNRASFSAFVAGRLSKFESRHRLAGRYFLAGST